MYLGKTFDSEFVLKVLRKDDKSYFEVIKTFKVKKCIL